MADIRRTYGGHMADIRRIYRYMADGRRTYGEYTVDIRQTYGEHSANMRQKWLRTYGGNRHYNISFSLQTFKADIRQTYANMIIRFHPYIPFIPTHFISLFHAFVVHHSHILDITHFYFMSIHLLVVL